MVGIKKITILTTPKKKKKLQSMYSVNTFDVRDIVWAPGKLWGSGLVILVRFLSALVLPVAC